MQYLSKEVVMENLPTLMQNLSKGTIMGNLQTSMQNLSKKKKKNLNNEMVMDKF